MSNKGRKWKDTSNHWTKNPLFAETLKQMALKLKGRPSNSGSFKKGDENPIKGKKLPWAKKAAEGRKVSGMYEKAKGNTWGFLKAHKPWNKGLKGVMAVPWNKGTHGKMPIPWNIGMGVGASLGLAIRSLPEYKIWRDKVFVRDRYTCRKCGIKGVKFHADHKRPFALICRENKISSRKKAIKCKKLWRVGNGQTLCIPCHKKTDTYSGKSNTVLYDFPRKVIRS